LRHGVSVWIADDAEQFAGGITRLLRDPADRACLARAARAIAEKKFDWKQLGEKQRALYRELLSGT
jgi:glycosyltransferase involved in cell wall biosynthesis